MNTRTLVIAVAISMLALIATSAAWAADVAASGSTSAQSASPERAFVGRLKGSNTFVAILVGQRRGARVYVYDSTTRIAAWFDPGPSPATRVEVSPRATRTLSSLSKDGYALEATIAGGQASGSVRFPSGVRHAFSAGAVAVSNGVHQIEIGQGVQRYLGGWIVWEPGRNLGYLLPAPVVSALNP